MSDRGARLAAYVWQRIKPLQWRVLRLRHPGFMVAAQALARDGHGRVLLVRHRMWPPGREWGMPGGYVNRGEELERAAEREVFEETGLRIEATRVLKITSGFRFRVQVVYAAELRGGTMDLDSREVIEARFVSPDDLPASLMPEHRAMIEQHAVWIGQARSTAPARPTPAPVRERVHEPVGGRDPGSDRHPTSSAIILDGDAVLLAEHRESGLLVCPGGHGEPGEDAVQTVVREVRAKLGVDVEILGGASFAHPAVRAVPTPFAIIEVQQSDHQHVDHIYVCRPQTMEPRTSPEDVDGCRWVPLADLDALELAPELPSLIRAGAAYARLHA